MLREKHGKGRLFYLLIMLIALIVLYPILQGSLFRGVTLNTIFTFILIAIVYGLRAERWVIIVGILIGVPWLAVVWINLRLEIQALRIVSAILMTLLFSYTLVLLIRHIREADEISADLLYGAGCIYMLIGFAWSGISMTIELLRPGSFMQVTASGYKPISHASDLVYYSFTTLTTLGYGDITPQLPMTRSLAILEAITGVLFMGILIGTLVGVFVATRTQNRRKE
jgi:hypothetical protein